MWPFRKKNKTKPNMYHGYDLNVWNYLGRTEIKFDGVPNLIHFFQKKDDGARSYTLKGRPEIILKTIAKLHNYVHELCELWRINEHELYAPIRNPSIFLKEWMLTEKGCVWNPDKEWWVLASDKDRYDHAVVKHQKKHPEIYTEGNIVTVSFNPKS